VAEVILFPDAEDLVRLHLKASFAARSGFTTVGAFTGSKPATLPGEFVFVRRTGGPARDIVTDQPQITIESYAKRGSRAVAIANLARGLLNAAARDGQMGDATVYGLAEFVGPYLDPDPDAPSYTRYSATYQLAVRGHAA
jgi:hypothetical protein